MPPPPPPLELPEDDSAPTPAEVVLESLPPCQPRTIHQILRATQVFQDNDEVNIKPDEVDLDIDFLSRSFSWLERALNLHSYHRNMRERRDDPGSVPPAVLALQQLLLRVIAEDTPMLAVLRKLQYFGKKYRDGYGEVGDEASRLLAVCETLLGEQRRRAAEQEATLKARRDRARKAWEAQQEAYLQLIAERKVAAKAPAAPPPPPPPPRGTKTAPPPPGVFFWHLLQADVCKMQCVFVHSSCGAHVHHQVYSCVVRFCILRQRRPLCCRATRGRAITAPAAQIWGWAQCTEHFSRCQISMQWFGAGC